MDGLQALEKLHNEKLSRKIPVYMLTTSTKDEHRVIAQKFGARKFFSKPTSMDQYQKIMTEIFDEIESNF
jgi:CheY-like chemotaxis protein